MATLFFGEALGITCQNLFGVIIIALLGDIPYLPLTQELVGIMTPVTEFQQYLIEMIEDERKTPNTKNNLIIILVRSAVIQGDKKRCGISDSEILGNLFLYNIAGHHYVSATFSIAITLLALNPGY
ncbi:hypothetical protein BJ878DRAFT_243825 [Calycina marina]|uniref:Uncharacterized protein n=1 Tax=Calycina marina TaxID=1763456 RepID=A0A9P8CBS1_9HELO|nr:hypothetical protein BJ878DRAFT_243825 [Calycina marina]